MTDVSRASFLWKAPKVFYGLHRKGSSKHWSAVILAGLQQVFERTWKFDYLEEGRQAGGYDATKGKSLDESLCDGVGLIWNTSVAERPHSCNSERISLHPSVIQVLRALFLISALGRHLQHSLLQRWDQALPHLPSHCCCCLTCPRSTHGTSPDTMSLSSDAAASWELDQASVIIYGVSACLVCSLMTEDGGSSWWEGRKKTPENVIYGETGRAGSLLWFCEESLL